MKRAVVTMIGLLLPLACAVPSTGAPAAGGRVALQLDTSEARAVLAIAERARAGAVVPEAAWDSLFASRPYVRLRQREESMHRPFTDDAFRAFVRSPELAARADSLRRTLEAWERTDLAASAARVLAYLPDSARIRASVYPVIKPRTNSFVFEASTDAAIFLYVDPAQSAAKFENTVAHEMHHIGFASLGDNAEFGALPPRVRTVLEWMGAFGEGFAMLAAAGGPDVHPHAASPPADRARWDRDVAHFDRDRRVLERFFMDVLDGRLADADSIQAHAFAFFGEQGPWYTVGYVMAAAIERHDGRAALVACMRDPRELLRRYDAVAPPGRRWSATLVRRLGTPHR